MSTAKKRSAKAKSVDVAKKTTKRKASTTTKKKLEKIEIPARQKTISAKFVQSVLETLNASARHTYTLTKKKSTYELTRLHRSEQVHVIEASLKDVYDFIENMLIDAKDDRESETKRDSVELTYIQWAYFKDHFVYNAKNKDETILRSQLRVSRNVYAEKALKELLSVANKMRKEDEKAVIFANLIPKIEKIVKK